MRGHRDDATATQTALTSVQRQLRISDERAVSAERRVTQLEADLAACQGDKEHLEAQLKAMELSRDW